MSALVAERNTQTFLHSGLLEAPLAYGIPELATDAEVSREAAHFIGACVVGREAEYTPEAAYDSLLDAARCAAEGDPTARKMLEANVRTDMFERAVKAGLVMKVNLAIDSEGMPMQHGQSMKSVQANSLRFTTNNAPMRKRTEAEVRNTFRQKKELEVGSLEDNYFVTFSAAPDDMFESAKKKAGFFTETMSLAIQVTTAEDDELTLESAFVAGKRNAEAERHDIEAVVGIAKHFGIDLAGMTATEILDTPLMIPKKLMPNGAVDLVKLYDEILEGTFFGEDKPQQDYLAFREECKERIDAMQPKVDIVIEELIRQAPFLKDEIDAVKLLGKLSGKQMVQQAVFDNSIDARVFGTEAAAYICEGRRQFALGNYEHTLYLTRRAEAVETSSSCPSGVSGGAEDAIGGEQGSSSNLRSLESCTFVSEKCPKCGDKKVLTTVTATEIRGSCGCVAKK